MLCVRVCVCVCVFACVRACRSIRVHMQVDVELTRETSPSSRGRHFKLQITAVASRKQKMSGNVIVMSAFFELSCLRVLHVEVKILDLARSEYFLEVHIYLLDLSLFSVDIERRVRTI